MNIYILHQNYYYNYDIDTKVNGKYIISDYDSNFSYRNLINVEVTNSQCFINSNNNVRIFYENNEYKHIEITIGNFYTLKLISGEIIILYIAPSFDNSFIQKELKDGKTISIGDSNNDDIIFFGVKGDKIELSNNKGTFHIKSANNKIPIYINGKRQNDVNIDNFDNIFIYGLRIIVCGNTLFINNVNNKVNISAKNLTNVVGEEMATPDVPNSFQSFGDFYDDDKYFFKSPVFQHNADTLKINVSEPPQKEEKDDESVLMTAVPTLLMSLASVVTTVYSIRQFRNGETDTEELLTSLLMAGSILIAGLLWPFIEKWVRNFQVKVKNDMREKKYLAYLNEKEEIFKKATNEQKISLSMNNPIFYDCESIIEERKPELFNRNTENDNFLTVRLGNGNAKLSCNLEYQKQDYILEKDPLIANLEKLIDKYQYINDVPYLLSLKEKNVCSFIVSDNLIDNYMNNILLQLVTYHSYLDLKIVILTSKVSELAYLKNLNHCWDNERSIRFYATNVNDAQNISSILERELNQRKIKNDTGISSPYYLIISDCISVYRNLNIIDDVIDYGKKYNFGLIMFDNKLSDIPNKCSNFVSISSTEGAFFQTNMTSSSIDHFLPEFVDEKKINIHKCLRLISDIPLKNNNSVSLSLPDNYDFLEMFNIGNIEQLNVSIKWDNSNLYNSLAAPLGIDSNGNIIYLDLHEKNHGPHGLIAGMTGSGKSELIITYILSMAVNYRPDEVQFVLIDYKGGGLAGAFENRKTGIKLPHLVGTITNLDKSEMKRTLVSIKSELQRRQRLFNEAKENLDSGNVDIYKYQKLFREGKVSKSLSHLFIICDEFAELKAQQPDFMEELVSAARIGRSLGIHLILSTQKPSGIVDEQIWSNSKFKISCKVQTTEDSNEVIKKPDAAFLKESGRFYLQVGYDEYFIEGQSAYTGNIYVPSETFNAKIDNSIDFINDSGEIIKSTNIKEEKNSQKSMGDELTNILKHIIYVAKQKKFKSQQLWLDNVPHIIYQNNTTSKYMIKSSPYTISPLIGEYDDPKNQRQGPVCLDITNNGNTYIIGSAGSGKTTLLSTFIYGSIIYHNCDELNIYIVDCGAEKLKIFQNAPQVGEVLTINDSEKVKYLFYMVDDEIQKRQKYYAEKGESFLGEVKKGKTSFNNLIIIINDIDAFKEVYENIYDEQFASITRNCTKYGIYFIVTGVTINSLGFLVENNFPQSIMLNMNDPTDYNVIFDKPPIPNNNPGRGIVKIDEPYEFQTALAFREEDYSKNMNYIFSQLTIFLKNHAKKVPYVPKRVTFEKIVGNITTIDSTPLGINEKTAQVAYYNFDKFINFISSDDIKSMTNHIPSIIKVLSMCKNNKIIIINSLVKTKFSDYENVKEFSSGFKNVINTLNQKISEENDQKDKVLIIMLGYTKLQNHFAELKENGENLITPEELITNSKDSSKYRFIIYEQANMFEELQDSPIYNMTDDRGGIWIGVNFETQSVFEIDTTVIDNYTSKKDNLVIVNDDKFISVKSIK